MTNVNCFYDSTRTFCLKPKSDLDHSYLKPPVISRSSYLHSTVCHFIYSLASVSLYTFITHHPYLLGLYSAQSFQGVAIQADQYFKSLGFGRCCSLLLEYPSLLALAKKISPLKPYPTSPW